MHNLRNLVPGEICHRARNNVKTINEIVFKQIITTIVKIYIKKLKNS